MYTVYSAIDWVLRIFEFALIARVLVSWLPVSRENKIIELLYTITEPVLGPIRNILNRSAMMSNSMFDFSPIVAFLLVGVARSLVLSIFKMLL